MASQEHILIVGAGIFGTSTAYHLTHSVLKATTQLSPPRTTKVTLLDHSPLGAGMGASEDINKIIRADYSQNFYMDLGYEAIEAWKSLSEPNGIFEGLYHQTGWVVLDDEQSDHCARIKKLYSERGR
jgi:sarcosine oxidase / L-pipecolate oxidase